MTEKKCSPCARSAALNVGDAICHKLRSATHCHELVEKVQKGHITVDRYLDILAGYARTPGEKERIQRLKRVLRED